MPEPESNVERDLALIHSEVQKLTKERDYARGQLLDSDRKNEKLQEMLRSSDLRIFHSSKTLSLQAVQLETRALELAERDANLTLVALQLSQLTEDLHQSNEFLAKRTAQLEAANAELRRLMQQKEDFVAALTHDLKSPLIACLRAVELLIPGKIGEEQKLEVYKQLLESIKGMLRMIWNLLDVYKNESGKLVPVFEQVNIRDLLTHCLSEFSFGIEEKQLHIRLELPEELCSITTDRILLRRVLINVFDNAIKFSPHNGEISAQTSRHDGRLLITICDSGPGMPEDQRKRIFEKYWQTKLGRDSGIGSGLGLHLSRQIMTLLGGTIECQSKEGFGTQFVIGLKNT